MEHSGPSFPRTIGLQRLSTSFLLFGLAPVLCAFTGFHTASYLLVGLYTWPRTSRVLVLTLGMVIFSYEFILKTPMARLYPNWKYSATEIVVFTCVIPYVLGVGALLVLAGLSP